jgi:uncharacterized membrane protein
MYYYYYYYYYYHYCHYYFGMSEAMRGVVKHPECWLVTTYLKHVINFTYLVAMMNWLSPCRLLAAQDQVRSEARNEDEMRKRMAKERNKQRELIETRKVGKSSGHQM